MNNYSTKVYNKQNWIHIESVSLSVAHMKPDKTSSIASQAKKWQRNVDWIIKRMHSNYIQLMPGCQVSNQQINSHSEWGKKWKGEIDKKDSRWIHNEIENTFLFKFKSCLSTSHSQQGQTNNRVTVSSFYDSQCSENTESILYYTNLMDEVKYPIF